MKNTSTQSPNFGKEEKGRTFNTSWYELHYRDADGNGEWYCTPSYRQISETEVSAKLKEFISNRNATRFDIGGMTVEFETNGRLRMIEVRIVKRESVCTIVDVQMIQSH